MVGITRKGPVCSKCEVCGNRINARKLWGDLQEGIKARILEPQRLVPGIKAQLESGKSLERLEEQKKSLQQEKEG